MRKVIDKYNIRDENLTDFAIERFHENTANYLRAINGKIDKKETELKTLKQQITNAKAYYLLIQRETTTQKNKHYYENVNKQIREIEKFIYKDHNLKNF